MRTEQPLQGDADIAPIGALIGDPTRARILTALTDGRALPASRLAAEAGVAPSTVSEHLARLLAAGLVTMRPEGRSRFYRLASPAVAEALDAISRISPPQPIRSLRQGTYARALREARTCHNHLAGRLGIGLLDGLLGSGLLSGGDGRHHPERAVADRLSAPGRDLSYRLTRAARPRSGTLAWTWTRYWPAIPPSGTASTGRSSDFQRGAPGRAFPD
jgi:DNA-binding transcriptional ArsR family regulator